MNILKRSQYILLGASLLIGTLLSVLSLSDRYSSNPFQPKSAYNLRSITEDLIQPLSNYNSLNQDERSTLRIDAQRRRDLLFALLQSDPRQFIAEARLAGLFVKLPPQAQIDFEELIEHPVNDSGQVSRIVAETDSLQYTEEQVLFTSDNDRKTYKLTIIDRASNVVSGQSQVTGLVLGDALIVPELQAIKTNVLASAVTSGPLRTLVMVFEFANSAPSERTFTIDDVKSRLLTAPDSSKNAIEKDSYYVAGSRGATILSNPNTDIYGWFKITNNKPASTSDCNVGTYASSAESAAKKLYSDISSKISNYDRIIYIWPRQENCYSPIVEGPWGGWGEISGRKSWINGIITTRVFAHELGHNFGLEHAVAIGCRKPVSDRAIDYFNLCRLPIDGGSGISAYEYGDRYDVMGSGGRYNADGSLSYTASTHTNARYKMKLSWLSSNRQKSVTSSMNNLILLPLENYSSSGYQVLRIPRPKGTASETFSSDYYYVEYRVPQPDDIDNTWPINTLSPGGILIRMYGNKTYLRSFSSSNASSVLVDAVAPFDSNFANAALYNAGNPDTDTFYDPINKIKIRLISASSSSATICVDINDNGTCGPVEATPTVTPTLSPTPTVTPTILPSPTPVFGDTPTPTPPSGGSQQTITFLPDADSHVDQSNPTKNYGTNATLSVNGGNNPIREAFIRFQVSGIAGIVQKATLRVYDTDNSSKDGPMVYAANSSWAENGITYDTKPARTSGVLDDVLVVGMEVWVDYNVTSAVTGEDGAYTFNLAPGGSDGLTFSSRQGVKPPELIVEYVQ